MTVLFSVDYNYLTKLDDPAEAIAPEIWNEWRATMTKAMLHNDEYKKIMNTRINQVATKLGVLWNNDRDEKIIEIISKPYEEIKGRKHIGEWYKRSTVLTIASLIDMNEEKWERLTRKKETARDAELKFRYQHYDNLRIEILRYITQNRDITNDNFEDKYKGFVKLVLRGLLTGGAFGTKDPKKYVEVFRGRFFDVKHYEQIAKEQNIYMGMVNIILKKFQGEFDTMFRDDHERGKLCRKWDKFFHEAFNALDDSDITERNKRLQRLNVFQEYFIADNLADYIKE